MLDESIPEHKGSCVIECLYIGGLTVTSVGTLSCVGYQQNISGD